MIVRNFSILHLCFVILLIIPFHDSQAALNCSAKRTKNSCNTLAQSMTARDEETCIWTNARRNKGNFCRNTSNTNYDQAAGNAFEVSICNLLRMVTGTGGRAFAAFAIISVGIGFFTGKVSWGLMIGVAAGVAAIFGAPTVVQALAGGSKLNADSCSSQLTN